ncbi:hypothetical protein [Curtobacterium sp. UCD-KPL2560]|uniref:hypothetical protein n=1 Tax=Curtobacterium sp. UCD-KPL2560 TaxID=1885315 RepID=UPI00149588AC|nr:hypothetical protein [Curtobacterium sp. UCD-KPL2560]
MPSPVGGGRAICGRFIALAAPGERLVGRAGRVSRAGRADRAARPVALVGSG